eukprot:g82870.t1
MILSFFLLASVAASLLRMPGDVATLVGKCSESFTAELLCISGLVVSPKGRTLFVSDNCCGCLRALDLASGVVSTLTKQQAFPREYLVGSASEARFLGLWGLALSRDGGTVFIAERVGRLIRALKLAEAVVVTVAGDGTQGYRDGAAAQAWFEYPTWLAMSHNGNTLFLNDGHACVRALTLSSASCQHWLAFVEAPATRTQSVQMPGFWGHVD